MIKVDSEKHGAIFNDIAAVAFSQLGLSGDGYVEVDFVSKDEIRSLNARTRNIDKVTDVLSYPSLDEIVPLTKDNYPYDYDDGVVAVNIGCIVICADVAQEQANEYGHSVERETCYLFTHGLLHLLGYDHIESEDKVVMRAAEESILNQLNITRNE